MFKKMSAGLATLTAVAVVIYVRFLRPWYLRWGATDKEVEQPIGSDTENHLLIIVLSYAKER